MAVFVLQLTARKKIYIRAFFYCILTLIIIKLFNILHIKNVAFFIGNNERSPNDLFFLRLHFKNIAFRNTFM